MNERTHFKYRSFYHAGHTYVVKKVGVLERWNVYQISKSGIFSSFRDRVEIITGSFYGDDELHALKNYLKVNEKKLNMENPNEHLYDIES